MYIYIMYIRLSGLECIIYIIKFLVFALLVYILFCSFDEIFLIFA